jgi:ATP-binding cassette, subfamily B, bacterial
MFHDARFLLGPHIKRLYLLGIMAAIVAVLEVVLLYLLAQIAVVLVGGTSRVSIPIGALSEQSLSLNVLLTAVSVVLATLIGLSIPLSRSAARTSEITIARTRALLIEAYLNAPWAVRSTDPEGHIQTLVGEYASRAERLIMQVSTLIVSTSTLALLGLSMILLAPVMSILALGALLGFVALLRPFSKRIRSTSRRFAIQDKRFAGQVAQAARVSQEVAAFNVQGEVLQLLHHQIQEAARKLRTVRLYQRLVPMLYQYCALAIIVAIVALLSAFDPEALLAAGPLVLTLVRALGYSKQTQSAIQAANEFSPYAEALSLEVARLKGQRGTNGEMQSVGFNKLEFRTVSFSYGPHTVLISAAFTIHAGETVGVIGPSGGGKSTLVQLLLRLRIPDHGHILVDGIDLRRILPECWAATAAFVPQDNKLILGTVADNIRFFRPWYTLSQVKEAAKAAHIHDEIEMLPAGYENLIGPGVSDLSGGQRQRLGIARAFLGNPQLIVLDEPTSALDSESENLIRLSLEKKKGDATIIIVAHRPATLEICDRVLLVENGWVTERKQANS